MVDRSIRVSIAGLQFVGPPGAGFGRVDAAGPVCASSPGLYVNAYFVHLYWSTGLSLPSSGQIKSVAADPVAMSSIPRAGRLKKGPL